MTEPHHPSWLPAPPPTSARRAECARDCEHGHVLQYFRKMGARINDWVGRSAIARFRDSLLLRGDVGGVRAAVGGGDHRLLVRVVNDDPPPLLIVASRRSLGRDAYTIQDQLARNRPAEVESLPHRAGGGEQVIRLREIEIHERNTFPRELRERTLMVVR